MDKVKDCFERIRVIKGVNHGIITNELIQHLFFIQDLNEEEKQKVFELLKQNNIIPISEADVPESVSEPPKFVPVQIENKTDEDEERAKLRKKRFEKEVESFLDHTYKKPTYLKVYNYEIPILVDAIITRSNLDTDPMNIILESVWDVCHHHLECAEEGLELCGTYLDNLTKNFEYRLRQIFSENDLWKLINSLSEDTQDMEQMQMLYIIIYLAPSYMNSARILHFSEDARKNRRESKERLKKYPED